MTLPPAVVARWAFLAVLPLWSIYLAHVVLGPHRPTGFLIFDSAYYCANAREIFERGNGLAYCNPFDPDPAAPVIYWHWLPWIVGVGTKFLGVDPGFIFCLAGAIGGFACAFLTFRLVEAILPASRTLVPCYLLVMWGGGLLVVSALATNLMHGQPPLYFLLQNDPFNGWWFLNWGRNLVLPTEAVYHALVAAAWLAAVRDRPWPAVGAVAALAATHPFSGIQHLLVIGASTGGPKALCDLLTPLPSDWNVAVVVVQHVDVAFAPGLAKWLGERTGHAVHVVREGERPTAGMVVVAGTNDHLVMTAERTLVYRAEPRDVFFRPSVDVFFTSVAEHWPRPGAAAVLTGMGRDGARGLAALRRRGWHTVVQDQATSVVWSMPKAAIDADAACAVLPIDRIPTALTARLRR
jgi:hypothetical protein